MSLETRSNSALMKRAEQLKRWQDSETAREPGDLKRKKRRIGFSDGCVFLAACAACDRDEVRSLISRGTDIDTANVDGLTALHQVSMRGVISQTPWCDSRTQNIAIIISLPTLKLHRLLPTTCCYQDSMTNIILGIVTFTLSFLWLAQKQNKLDWMLVSLVSMFIQTWPKAMSAADVHIYWNMWTIISNVNVN